MKEKGKKEVKRNGKRVLPRPAEETAFVPALLLTNSLVGSPLLRPGPEIPVKGRGQGVGTRVSGLPGPASLDHPTGSIHSGLVSRSLPEKCRPSRETRSDRSDRTPPSRPSPGRSISRGFTQHHQLLYSSRHGYDTPMNSYWERLLYPGPQG